MMKEKKIAEIVKDRFRKIGKFFQKIIKDFDSDDIHDFRVEIKKLRAFLRLLDTENEMDHPLITERLKFFYGYVGVIRNIHLHRQTLYKYMNDYKIEKPAAYFKILDEEENYQRRQADAIRKGKDFNEEEKEILKELPHSLEKSTIKKFVEKKLKELKEELKNIQNDTAVHNVRKILKDILYLWDYLKANAKLPAAISKKDNLKLLTDMLGDFMDKSIQLEFLQPLYLDKVNSNTERNILEKIRDEFQHEKQIMVQELSYSFNELQEQL